MCVAYYLSKKTYQAAIFYWFISFRKNPKASLDLTAIVDIHTRFVAESRVTSLYSDLAFNKKGRPFELILALSFSPRQIARRCKKKNHGLPGGKIKPRPNE